MEQCWNDINRRKQEVSKNLAPVQLHTSCILHENTQNWAWASIVRSQHKLWTQNYTVAYRPIAKHIHNHRKTVFSLWSVLRCYNGFGVVSSFQFSSILYGSVWRDEERTWACEAEESPLLEAVAMEWLAGKYTACRYRLSGCCGDLWIVEISSGAVIACSSESCI
jgi:hypothetical protein